MRSLPFTTEAFLAVFEEYNLAIWPAQVLAYVLGLAVVVLIVRPGKGTDRAVAAILAVAWLWMGAGYHMRYFAVINPAAWIFGALFVAHGVLLAWLGVARVRLQFRFVPDLYGWTGLGFMVFAMAVYPLLGPAVGQGWPHAAMFGVAPCPTTIFTIGALVLAAGQGRPALMVIPFLWSLVGGSAAFLLDVPQDLALPVAGVAGVVLISMRTRRGAAGGIS